jgi:hypothetical protein
MEWILKFSPTPSRATVIQTMGTVRRKLKQQPVMINERLDALKQELLPFLRGHAAASSYCHVFSEICTTQILKLNQTQSTSYLGLKQVDYCHSILNTWRNTDASVGLDLDSPALWSMVLLVTD